MKGLISTAALLAACSPFVMAADCSSGGSLVADVAATLNDMTVCGSATNGDTWQEWHQSTGTLTEYALGTNPVDPSHDVGTWSSTGTAGEIQYNYNGGSTFTFELYQNGSTFYFCDSTTTPVATATLGAPNSACP